MSVGWVVTSLDFILAREIIMRTRRRMDGKS